MTAPKKELGQHWLRDRLYLSAIADAAEIKDTDTVLEIGPGQGALTSELIRRAKRVIAVEYDEELAAKLPKQFPGTSLEVNHADILDFDLSQLPSGYKVVANVPYYITSKIVEKLLTAENKPKTSVLLVQKEVAQRIAAKAGDMSLLALSTNIYATATLDIEVPRQYFVPAPKVDSQVVVIETRETPLVAKEDEKAFWKVARAGFVGKRKKLRGSISAGLSIEKYQADELLNHASIDPNKRAEDLSMDDWLRLAKDAA